MNTREINKLVRSAYDQLGRLNDIKMVSFRDRCYDMALTEERQHRKSWSDHATRNKSATPQAAARLFVVKRIAQFVNNPASRPGIAQVLHYQPSAIYAASIVENYPEECTEALAGFDLEVLAELDYVQFLGA